MKNWINVLGKILGVTGIIVSALSSIVGEVKLDQKIDEKVQKALANMNKNE